MKIAGKPVRDARKALYLDITRKDVENSSKKDPNNCAAAIACKRQEHVKDVRVHLSHTYVDRGTYWERYSTPTRMRTEIVSFDRGAQFEPDNYKLLPPRPSQKLGRDTRKKKPDKRKRHDNGSEKMWHAVTGVRASAANKNVWSSKSKKEA